MIEQPSFLREMQIALEKEGKALKRGDFQTAEEAKEQFNAYKMAETAKNTIFRRRGVAELTRREIEIYSPKNIKKLKELPLGELIKALRDQAMLTQAELSELIGSRSHNLLHKLESGITKKPRAHTINSIISALDLAPDDPRAKLLREKAGIGIEGTGKKPRNKKS